jgi:hypothetical protein
MSGDDHGDVEPRDSIEVPRAAASALGQPGTAKPFSHKASPEINNYCASH